MNITAIVLLSALSTFQADPNLLPGPYPFNSDTGYGRKTTLIDRVALAKFVERSPIDPLVQRSALGPLKPQMFIDSFEVLQDSGEPTSKRVILKVIVGTTPAALPGGPPEVGSSYMLATRATNGSIAGVFVTRRGGILEGDGPQYAVHVDDGVVIGLLCYPLEKLVRSRTEDGTEDRFGTIILSLIEPIRHAKAATDIARPLSMMEAFDLRSYHDREHFGSGIAGQKAADWIRDHFWPRLDEAVKGKPMEVKLEAFAMLATFPGAKSAEYGRELFEYVLKQIHTTGRIPGSRSLIGNAYVDADRIIAEADRMPWNVRKSFIGSLSRPLSERSVAILISWLDKADGTLAHFLLDKLAKWAKRKDLEPQIAEKYKDGHPVILNRQVLSEIWKSNPPPLHKRGG